MCDDKLWATRPTEQGEAGNPSLITTSHRSTLPALEAPRTHPHRHVTHKDMSHRHTASDPHTIHARHTHHTDVSAYLKDTLHTHPQTRTSQTYRYDTHTNTFRRTQHPITPSSTNPIHVPHHMTPQKAHCPHLNPSKDIHHRCRNNTHPAHIYTLHNDSHSHSKQPPNRHIYHKHPGQLTSPHTPEHVTNARARVRVQRPSSEGT